MIIYVCIFDTQNRGKLGKSHHKSSPTISKYWKSRILMPQHSRNFFTHITIHQYYLGRIKNKILVPGTLEIPIYPLHIHLMWCLGVMSKLCTPMNIK